MLAYPACLCFGDLTLLLLTGLWVNANARSGIQAPVARDLAVELLPNSFIESPRQRHRPIWVNRLDRERSEIVDRAMPAPATTTAVAGPFDDVVPNAADCLDRLPLAAQVFHNFV